MRVIIMAAGKGTRISRHIEGRPKCTLEVDGIPLIESTIKLLLDHGITDIAIVLGYRGEVIRDILKEYDIKYYTNPFYEVTNSISSLWFAKDFLINDDLILMNGDVFMESALFSTILSANGNPLLFSDSSRIIEADYKLQYTESDGLTKYGKELKPEETTGEYIGVAKLDKSFISDFNKELIRCIDQGQSGLWWENVLYNLSSHQKINVYDVVGQFWGEVDFIEDYERIMEFTNGSNR